jgi:3-phenylpropionate/cinnamic acid dioxygenase small subunit
VSKEVDPVTDLTIRRLIARYSQLVDDGDFKAAADLFSEDGRFNALGQDLRGRQAVVEWLGSLTATMWHNVTNVVVSNGSNDGTYHAVCDLALHTKGEDGAWTVRAVARYHDTFAGTGRGMHFTQRILKAR